MTSTGKILIADDNKEILTALRLFLADHFKDIVTTSNPNLIPGLLREHDFDAIILDMNFSIGIATGNEGLFWLREILKIDMDAVVILLTAYGNVEMAISSLKEGATDFLQKPWNDDKLLTTVHSAVELRKSRREVSILKNMQKHLNDQIRDGSPKLIYISETMKEVMQTVGKVAETDANILIQGENGTGKELVAHEIHFQSQRKSKPFISVDLGSLADTLFESEMFGYEKGAFTDAKDWKPGRFEITAGGTIFLDEIGNIPLYLQTKLLTVINTGKVTRLGSNIPVKTDFRLVTATNASLEQMVKENSFREDLLYRINTIQIDIPPLRERKEDIVPLSEYFLQIYCSKYGKEGLYLSRSAVTRLKRYPFPGNIRELQHIIEKAVILAESTEISSDEVAAKGIIRMPEKELNLNLIVNEKKLITLSLEKTGNNFTEAASELGITRKTLYNKIKRYGLQ